MEFSIALCVQCLFREFRATLLFALAGVSKFKARVFVGKRILVPLECSHAQQPVARGRGSVEVSAVNCNRKHLFGRQRWIAAAQVKLHTFR
ncbi:MAG: hypothetical protein DMG18_15630 [Acidobacteria bacterium]|nr:MAG: hypothetical protein DMG18_15630 [Acidobacteriota bacterium]